MNDAVNISDQLALYAKLNKQKNAIDKRLKEIKSTIQSFVEKAPEREIVDEAGVAKMIDVQGGYSVSDAAKLHEHATIWAESGNEDIATIGKTVLTFVNKKDGYSYVKITT